MAEYTLLIILFAPFVGALALIFVSNRQVSLVRGVAAGSAFVTLVASIYLFYAYDPIKGGYQFIQRLEWSRQLGISLHLGVDGIGTPLVLASGILLFAGIFVSWHIKDRMKEFYIWILILAAATIGGVAYGQHCARCHGAESANSVSEGPDLRRLNSFCNQLNRAELKPRCLADVDRYFLLSVREGKVRSGLRHMPAWEGVLPQETLWAIRSFTETRPLPPPRSQSTSCCALRCALPACGVLARGRSRRIAPARSSWTSAPSTRRRSAASPRLRSPVSAPPTWPQSRRRSSVACPPRSSAR